jgi:hypothetical protein
MQRILVLGAGFAGFWSAILDAAAPVVQKAPPRLST